jgi:exopolyphosphatase/guanosine-5'-triphosphate,3'-diphosphate pyrophosphatase
VTSYRIAVVDIGSNSLKFSIADVNPDGGETIIQADAQTVRLAAGIASSGMIQPERARHAVEAMQFYDQIAKALRSDAQLSVATAALRMASNGQHLIEQIEATTNWRIQVISGEEEAVLAFSGLVSEMPETGSALLLDVGGGSTEAIHIVDRRLQVSESNDIGSGTLADASFTSDPPGLPEVLAAKGRAHEVLSGSPVISGSTGSTLVLSGGNGQFLEGFALWDRVAIPFEPEHFDAITAALADVPSVDVASFLGIAPERARMLPAGAAIASTVIDMVGPISLQAVPSGIRSGLIARWLAEHAKQPGSGTPSTIGDGG